MKTKIYYWIIISISLCSLYCGTTFSQSSKSTNSGDNLNPKIIVKEKDYTSVKEKTANNQETDNSTKKPIGASQKNKLIDVKVQSEIDEVSSDNDMSSAETSSEVDQIDLTVDAGDSNTQIITIQNSDDSPLIWNVIPDGSEKLLYRLYVKDRELLKLNGVDESKSDDILAPTDFNVRKTVLEMNSEEDNLISETILAKKISLSKQTDFINANNDVKIQDVSDKLDRLNQSKFINTNAMTQLKNIQSEANAYRPVDKSELLKNEKLSDPNDRLQVFKQWFRFSDYARPIFDPQVEVWEVSRDNGVHWVQILNIDREPYVIDASSFDPVFYIQYHVIKKRNSPYSKLALLSDFVKQVEQGPTIIPKSGIIPANSSKDINLNVDATSIEKGNFNPKLIVTDAVSMKTIETITLHLEVISESEKSVENELSKQTIGEQIPDKYELFQNYPNPFNPSTTIKYDLPEAGFVTIKIYDILGREVSSLLNEEMKAGSHQINFDASSLSSGTYFYRIQAADFVETKKMVLLK